MQWGIVGGEHNREREGGGLREPTFDMKGRVAGPKIAVSTGTGAGPS